MCYTFGYIRTHTYVRCKSVKVAARYAPLVAIAFSAVNATATVQVTHCSVPWRVKRASSTNKQNIHTNNQTHKHLYIHPGTQSGTNAIFDKNNIFYILHTTSTSSRIIIRETIVTVDYF